MNGDGSSKEWWFVAGWGGGGGEGGEGEGRLEGKSRAQLTSR